MAAKRTALYLLAFAFVASALLLGTATGRADSNPKKDVTFSKDVAPILYKNCVECHRPNDLAPMSLIEYKDARPWARSIREKVVDHQMPPWGADSKPGEYANDRRLSQQEIDTISAWVDQGAKEGDPKDLPAKPSFVEGWQIGKPDVVLSMAEEYKIPANGPDQYVYFTIPTNFKQDMWVTAAEARPGNKRVVHHIIAFIQTPEQVAALKAQGDGNIANRRPFAAGGGTSIFYKDGTLVRVKADAPVIDDGCGNQNGGSALGNRRGGGDAFGQLLAGYAPGKDVEKYPDGYAKLVPAGSSIVFQMHYSNFKGAMNQPETDRSSIGLVFSKEPPSKMSKMIVTRGIQNHYFKIPPGDPDHEVTACYTFDQDVRVIDYMPHMHLRGKDMKYEAVYPDGRKETLLWVPKYSFNWQTVYKLANPITLPKGTKLIVTAHFDNSERNKYNPGPTQTVRWGDPTYDEMMIGWLDYIADRPAERVVAKLDPKIYDGYIGTYQFGPGITLTITRDGDKLLGQATGQPQVQFFPESETKFFLKVIDGDLTFVKNEKGEVTEVIFNMNGRPIHGKKISPTASTAGGN